MTANEEQSEDRRAFARLHLLRNVRFVDAAGVHDVSLRDLSLGGARLLIPGSLYPNPPLTLIIPRRHGGEDALRVEIVRRVETEESALIGLRFLYANDTEQDTVRSILYRHIGRPGEGADRRAHPRLALRLEVRYESDAELQGIIEDISRGGLAMTTPEPLEPGQKVSVIIPDSKGDDLLSLTATVVHVREATVGPHTTRAGLQFTPMSDERRALLDEFLRLLLSRQSV